MTAPFELLEPLQLDDTYTLGVGRIEQLGPCVRVVFYITQQCSFERARTEHIAVARLVIPTEELATVARQLLQEPEKPARPMLEAVTLN